MKNEETTNETNQTPKEIVSSLDRYIVGPVSYTHLTLPTSDLV